MTPAWEEATSFSAVHGAFRRAARGSSGPAVAAFRMDAERELLAIRAGLRLPPGAPGAWVPGAARTFHIRDPKPRTIQVVPFRDRVVHHVMAAVIEPALDRVAIHHSYACRRGRGPQRARLQAQRWMRRYPAVLKLDVAAFFPTIPHGALLDHVDGLIAVPEVVAWIRHIVGDLTGRGLPIGALLSQLLANAWLGRLDHHVTDQRGFGAYLRYMDDTLVFGEGADLVGLQVELLDWLPSHLGQRFHPTHCWLQSTATGLPFLGAVIERGRLRIAPERARVVRRRLEHLGQHPDASGAASASAMVAHLAQLDTLHLRRRWFTPKPGGTAGLQRGKTPERDPRRPRREPGDPGRLLELQPAGSAGGEPQDQAPVRPERQPRLPPSQLGAPPPDDRSPRTPVLCRGADPARVPGLVRGRAESARPGGGSLRGVASGLTRGRRC